MELIDFISSLPIDNISKTSIDKNRITLPICCCIDPNLFYANFRDNIESSNLTAEKAIYIGLTYDLKKYISSIDMLNSHLYFD